MFTGTKKCNKMKKIAKQIKGWMTILIFMLSVSSCIQDNFWYSGVSNGKFDGSLLEYLEARGGE